MERIPGASARYEYMRATLKPDEPLREAMARLEAQDFQPLTFLGHTALFEREAGKK